MKVSLNWVKQYTDIDAPVNEIVEKIGSQLGGVEEVIDLGAKYRGVLAVKVVECRRHENSDHLNVCKIDDGGKVEGVERDENGLVQVVCGAPNVRAGITVAWIPPRATVPATFGTSDPFVMESRALRGEMSNGMLASPKELAIGDSHEGILEIDKEITPGQVFAEVYDLNDYIIDIENKMFTHRPDCFGQLGVAREVSGIFHQQFVSPEWYVEVLKDVLGQNAEALPLEVKNEVPELVPRFMAVALSGIQVKPSPMWLQTYLSRVGIRPINNVVDVTNYVMMLTAQPLHAYDYDKVLAQDADAVHATLIARLPHEGEVLELLNGKTIEPRKEAILITSATRAIGLGGVMGGANTEVDVDTHNIILECATFDMYSIRRTSMAHGIFSDAVTRFNKGQSPLQNDKVLAKSVQMLRELAGAAVSSEVYDLNTTDKTENEHVTTTQAFINERLGLFLNTEAMAELLHNVEFEVTVEAEKITARAPFWRTDIEIPEDIVEEVGRLYGYDSLPQDLPLRSIKPAPKNELLELKAAIREALSRAGANEVLTYSFVHGNLLDKTGQDKQKAFKLGNAISPDLQYYRMSLTPSLLDKVHANSRAGYDQFGLFEIAKVHVNDTAQVTDELLPAELERVALVLAADDKKARTGAAYYSAQKYLKILLESLGIENFTIKVLNPDAMNNEPTLTAWSKPYDLSRSAGVFVNLQGHSDTFLGIVGEYRRDLQKALKLPTATAGFELDTLVLSASLAEGNRVQYQPIPRFPKVEQDISLKVDSSLPFGELHRLVVSTLEAHKPANTLLKVSPLDIYQREDDHDHKQIAFHVEIASYEKTMTDQEVNVLLDAVAEAAHAEFAAERL